MRPNVLDSVVFWLGKNTVEKYSLISIGFSTMFLFLEAEIQRSTKPTCFRFLGIIKL